jgi:hypothetical protein
MLFATAPQLIREMHIEKLEKGKIRENKVESIKLVSRSVCAAVTSTTG